MGMALKKRGGRGKAASLLLNVGSEHKQKDEGTCQPSFTEEQSSVGTVPSGQSPIARKVFPPFRHRLQVKGTCSPTGQS